MKVAIHQPQYWPWPPYIHKIMDADIFVYLDTVQFSKNGFQNRNQVRTKAGATWLTLPVEHHFGQTIRETRIADTIAAEKHFKTLAGSYGKSAGFRIWRDEIGEILNGSGTSLCDIAVASSDWMVDKLNIPTRRLFASELGEFSQTASGLVAEICRRLGATEYLSGTGATTYMNEADFQRIGCRVVRLRIGAIWHSS